MCGERGGFVRNVTAVCVAVLRDGRMLLWSFVVMVFCCDGLVLCDGLMSIEMNGKYCEVQAYYCAVPRHTCHVTTCFPLIS